MVGYFEITDPFTPELRHIKVALGIQGQMAGTDKVFGPEAVVANLGGGPLFSVFRSQQSDIPPYPLR